MGAPFECVVGMILVTGATGFIGRHLVEFLLEREGTIYVLVREGSRGRLEELRSRWAAPEDRIVPIIGDLSQARLGVSDDDVERLRGDVDAVIVQQRDDGLGRRRVTPVQVERLHRPDRVGHGRRDERRGTAALSANRARQRGPKWPGQHARQQ